MAERRMLSKRVVSSAKFLKMPASSQALYMHLSINADDDGIVEAYTIMRLCGATEDDLRILVAKGYVIVLNEDLVVYLTDWRENNRLRADRKVDSIYKDLLLQIVPDVPMLEAKPRADAKKDAVIEEEGEEEEDGQRLDNQRTSNGQPTDNQRTTSGRPMDGIGKYSIGKYSIDKYSIGESAERGETSRRFKPPTLDEVKAYCLERKNQVDPEAFFNFYESKGWMVGKNKMKDFKAAVRTWERTSRNKGSTNKQNNFNNFQGRNLDVDALEAMLVKRKVERG